MQYHMMLTRKISDLKGRPQIEVQVMNLKNGKLIYFTLDELDKNELPGITKGIHKGGSTTD